MTLPENAGQHLAPVPIRLLYVEPDKLSRTSIGRRLESFGVTLQCVHTAHDAAEAIMAHKPDAILCTWRHVDALDVLLVADGLGIPIRIFSGSPAEPALADRWILKVDTFALETFVRDVQEGRAA